MCGITGFAGRPNRNADQLAGIVGDMAQQLHHRGPDDSGVWSDPETGLALGHRRLSIIDLSEAGHQPMVSQSGRYVIVFNGEIYNHAELRAELSAMRGGQGEWRGHSDTETLLAGIESWGLEDTLRRCTGMFALAVWDRRERVLQLARDRFGEKPLYFGWTGSGENRAFLFASELKAMTRYPGFSAEVSRRALVEFFRLNYIPAPLSIYEGIWKIEPGCLLSLGGDFAREGLVSALPPGETRGNFSMRRWWSMPEAIGAAKSIACDDDTEALSVLESRLGDAVRRQSLTDVPLGAFLSGGVDSSLIAALMQTQAREEGRAPVRTFTIGFDEPGYDEAPYAEAVAGHLGTIHTTTRVTSADALAVIPNLPEIYDEPFADSSQIPTHLVARSARQHVTVALSGDGGDELFGGYNRYIWGPKIWRRISGLPLWLRRTVGAGMAATPVALWDIAARAGGAPSLAVKARNLAPLMLRSRGFEDLYRTLVSEWQEPYKLVRGAQAFESRQFLPQDDFLSSPVAGKNGLPQGRMMHWDTATYLPDDILCKVDRAAMAASLETRAPFLDHGVFEAAWRLPERLRANGSETKIALRRILYRHVPRDLIERPKAGFAVPVGQWLRGPLREWAEDLLSAERLAGDGYLDVELVRSSWEEHVSGRRDRTASIWGILMFQAWLSRHRR